MAAKSRNGMGINPAPPAYSAYFLTISLASRSVSLMSSPPQRRNSDAHASDRLRVYPRATCRARGNYNSRLRAGRIVRQPVHMLAQAQRSHVGPHFLDVSETLVLRPAASRFAPARGYVSPVRPDRVLLFVIDDDAVDARVAITIGCDAHVCSLRDGDRFAEMVRDQPGHAFGVPGFEHRFMTSVDPRHADA